jgi:hypothetical protein
MHDLGLSRNILKLFIILSINLIAPLAGAQEEKAVTAGSCVGYSIGWRNLSDWGLNFKPSLQYKFSKHWSVHTEIIVYCDENRRWFLPGIYAEYTIHNLKKLRFFPYLSFGLAGWLEPKHEGGAILINIRTGVKYYLIKQPKWGMVLNFALTSTVNWLDAQLGLTFSVFD